MNSNTQTPNTITIAYTLISNNLASIYGGGGIHFNSSNPNIDHVTVRTPQNMKKVGVQ